MIQDYISQALDWIMVHGLQIAGILFALWLARHFTAAIVGRLVRKTIKREGFASKREEKQREDTLVGIMTIAVRIAVWIIGFMLIAQNIGVELGPLLAGASILGVALGFGTQTLVKDMISGIFIIVENQYRVGDWVEIAGVDGEVQIINMRQTVLRDIDGNVHHIPNSLVGVATNQTSQYSGINISFGVDYDTDIDKLEEIINDVGAGLAGDPDWETSIEIPPKFIRINSFKDSSMEVIVRGQVKSAEQWAVEGELHKRLKQAFDKNKITIAYPQLVLHQMPKKK